MRISSAAAVRRAVVRASATTTTRTTIQKQQARCFTIHKLAGQDDSDFNLWKKEPKYKLGKHRSNALELVEQQPIIEVEGDMAICDGGGGALGHPLEYIKVGHLQGKYKECIYCGLKYKKKGT